MWTEAKLKGYILAIEVCGWGKGYSNESWKKTLGSQKPNRKWAEWQPKQESTYSFSWCWWRGSCCRWRWLWVRTSQADHRSMWQRFWVLQDSYCELNIRRLAMTTKDGRGQSILTLHQSCDRGKGGIRRSAWTHNWPRLGFTPPSGPFMQGTEEVIGHSVSDQLTNGLNFLNKEDICTFCFPQERVLPNW
jgi:hypothetical protein